MRQSSSELLSPSSTRNKRLRCLVSQLQIQIIDEMLVVKQFSSKSWNQSGGQFLGLVPSQKGHIFNHMFYMWLN